MHRYGLIGKTLKHSFSKQYFTEKFSKEGLKDYTYDNFELAEINKLPQLISDNKDLKGLNITIPYKQEIIPFLNEENEIVQATGACNCIKLQNGKLYGYNTDVMGFRNSLKKRLKPYHTSALVLGTGGASKGVQYALSELSMEYTIVSRRKDTNQLGYEDLGEKEMADNLVIINTTPLGMFPAIDDDPPIPFRYITNRHLLFDLIYNPTKTKFLKKGEERGAEILNGLEMLILQAEESWRIWNEKPV
jgi:shikimate dehydrogenase